jgi:GntR family transcriptional regulator
VATRRGSAVPKYYRISQGIVARIRAGKLRPGDRISSENEIIRRYGVSNTTARKALQELERGGWAARIKGKGTFVRARAVDRSVDRILGFTKNMLQAGRRPETRLLGTAVRRGSTELTVHGRKYTLRGPACVIERLRLADGLPMMRETRTISLRFCPGIEQKDLTGSLYGIYRDDYGVELVEIQQMLSAVLLSGDETACFGAAEPVPAFRVDGVTFCGKELVLEMECSVYRGDMYRFLVRATGQGGGEAR